MRIKKTSQTTTMSAQVVNTYSESTEDTYSCDYENKKFKDKIDMTTPMGSSRKIVGIGLDYHNNQWMLRVDVTVDGTTYTQWFNKDDGTL